MIEADGTSPAAAVTRRGTVVGTAAVSLAQAWRIALGLISMIVLARLLDPRDFGLVAMIWPIVGLVGLFQDWGLAQAVIQQQVVTRSQLNSLFWLASGAGTCGFALLAATSPLVADFYGEQRLIGIQATLALALILAALTTIPVALLTRQMRFVAASTIESLAALASFLVSVVLALLGFGPWALVVANLIGPLVMLAGATLLTRWLPGKPSILRDSQQLIKFGGGVFIFNVSNFLARNAHSVVIGYSSGSAPLGLYDRAARLLVLPLQQVSGPLSKVGLPVLARLREDPARYCRIYLRLVGLIMLATQPATIILTIAAEEAVPFLLGSQWSGAAPIFALLGLAALHQPASMTLTWIFQTQGRTGESARISVLATLITVAAMIAGSRWGVTGVALGYVLVELGVRAPALWICALRRGPVNIRSAGPTLIAHSLAAAGAAGAQLALRVLMDASLARFVSEAITVSIVYIALLLLFRPGRDLLGLIAATTWKACSAWVPMPAWGHKRF